MRIKKSIACTVLFALAALAGHTALAAPAAAEDKDVERILRKLDIAAANFRSTSADFQFDSYQTDPVPDKDTQKGTVYYERKDASFQMAAHIRELNGKPVPKMYTYSGGLLKLYEPLPNQVTTIARAGKFESYLMLGFGASGKEMAEKWEIKYLGPETLDGVKTERLELLAKDPAVLKNLPKVLIWVDAERGVSLKQVFDEGGGVSRVCVYFNFKVNLPLPADAFALKTNGKTTYVSH